MSGPGRLHARAVLGLFVVSGALGLGYQVLWSKVLLEFIGAGAYSYSTVLAAFMGGLALGSALLGRRADRVRNPLALYAALEAGVGLYALAYPTLASLVASLYARWASVGPGPGAASGLATKAAASALLLLVPTVLMGGTYPAMVRHATERLGLVGRRASQLYAANAVGAVLGALLMAFVLMPGLGMRRSLLLLAAANGLVALAALALSAQRPQAADAEAATAAEGVAPALEPLGVRLALALILVEGLVAFCLEIAWTRYFSLVLGSSTYSFTIMLAAFISGIALGSAWLARVQDRIDRPLAFFGWTQILAGLAVLLPLPLYAYAPWLSASYGALFSTRDGAFFLYEAGMLLLAYLVMLPATVLIGMSLPLVVKGASQDLARLGQDAGRVYAWNTAGNVAGALLGGLMLLPALGMERLFRASAIGSACVGLAAVWLYAAPQTARRDRAVAGGLLALLLACGAAAGPWRTEWFAISPFRRNQPLPSFAEKRAQLAESRTLLFEDDPAAHLMIYEAGGQYTLFVNGKPDASSGWDMVTQVLSAHIPLLLAPHANDVLIVGLASGVTSGAALTHPIGRLDVVDIVAAMPRASRFFQAWNGDPLSDPRSHFIADDARSYLSYTPRRYDVIISEPSNPWMAGTGALFAREFYARAKAALREDGVYLQWIQTYEMSDDTFAAVLGTFRQAFPFVYGFQGNSGDLLLLGARKPLQPDWAQVQERLGTPAVRTSLERIQVLDVATFLSFQLFSPASVDYIAALASDENTDDNHLLEYRAPRDLFKAARVSLWSRLDERLHAGPSLLWSDFLRRRTVPVDPLAALRALSATRVRVPPVVGAYQVAAYHVMPSALSLDPGDLLFPKAFHFEPPLASVDLANRLRTLVREKRADLVADVVQSYAAALLLESALSPEAAASWLHAADEWMVALPLPELRRFRIELLMAVGRGAEAARQLSAWVGETPGPEAEWATLRACEIDAATCTAVVDALGRRNPAPFLVRLRAQRAARP